uniref:Uncharacterized protein n=1 Tax=Sphaerodactylus townsendi TaxID=933632 RepID=A0ACB8F9Z0_9SAUR
MCLWCTSNKKCIEYPVRSILPPSSVCALSSARWGVCGGRKRAKSKPDREDEKAAREKEQRRVRQEERRAEMKSRHDEIRKKYGLFKEENPYAKFENN